MLDLFSCMRKRGDTCPIFSGHADLPARAAVPDSFGRGSARYIWGVWPGVPGTGPGGIPRDLFCTPFSI